MDVHAHTHTPRKTWTNYFWEFLMLFLAVFCGFLAENQREHMIEHKRAKQFAISLLSDLKGDTAALNTAIGFGNRKIIAVDSLIAQIEQPREKWKDLMIYTYGSTAGRYRPFGYNSGTYDQMKASGSLRYFKHELTDLLNQYDVQAKKASVRDAIHLHYASDIYNPFLLQVVDIRPAIQIQDDKPPTYPLVYRKSDKETIALWINYATVVQSTQQRTVVEYEIMIEKAREVIAGLKKEYHIE